ncbi:hypothetical protein B0H14DRAFT_3773620 [Mycena olivaceomarginata]|nr:hypothetical protein B0H14DRAFT_3773620 [Mycena olivaceomarginata]
MEQEAAAASFCERRRSGGGGATKEAGDNGAGRNDAKFYEGSEWRASIILTVCLRQGNQAWEDGEAAGVGDPEASLTASWCAQRSPKKAAQRVRASQVVPQGETRGCGSGGVNALGAALNVELEWFIGGAQRRTQKRRRAAGRLDTARVEEAGRRCRLSGARVERDGLWLDRPDGPRPILSYIVPERARSSQHQAGIHFPQMRPFQPLRMELRPLRKRRRVALLTEPSPGSRSPAALPSPSLPTLHHALRPSAADTLKIHAQHCAAAVGSGAWRDGEVDS